MKSFFTIIGDIQVHPNVEDCVVFDTNKEYLVEIGILVAELSPAVNNL